MGPPRSGGVWGGSSPPRGVWGDGSPQERGGLGGSSPRGMHSTLKPMHADDLETWAAPAAAGPVSARIRLPASKSITNRALVLAALSDQPARIANPLRARDTLLAAAALRAMGTEVADEADGSTAVPGGSPPASHPRGRGSASTSATRARSCGSCPRSPR